MMAFCCSVWFCWLACPSEWHDLIVPVAACCHVTSANNQQPTTDHYNKRLYFCILFSPASLDFNYNHSAENRLPPSHFPDNNIGSFDSQSSQVRANGKFHPQSNSNSWYSAFNGEISTGKFPVCCSTWKLVNRLEIPGLRLCVSGHWVFHVRRFTNIQRALKTCLCVVGFRVSCRVCFCLQ